MSFGQLLTTAIAFSSTASAWPSWLPEVDALVVRQDDPPKGMLRNRCFRQIEPRANTNTIPQTLQHPPRLRTRRAMPNHLQLISLRHRPPMAPMSPRQQI